MPTLQTPAVTVTTVVVAHDGGRWLPGLRAALAAQSRPPDVVVGADTGTGEELTDWLSAAQVVRLDPRTGFGAAVQAALDLAPPAAGGDREHEWIWLLHDDCEPGPAALHELLTAVARDPATAVAGPKVLGLADRRLLLEVGVTIARGGRRETGLERREHDQGQHEGVRRVLAVGTAGMLVRRDVWDDLGGLDPALPLLRDDVDLGWRANLAGHRVVVVPRAVLHHAEAATHRRRALGVPGRLHLLDRRHALYVLLANLPATRMIAAVPVLTVATLLRALGLLLSRRPVDAVDELRALGGLLVRPDRLLAARGRRRRTRRLPARSALPLLAPPGAGVRHGLEGLALLLGSRTGALAAARQRARLRPGSAAETGPTDEDADDLPSLSAGLVRHLVVRPSVLLVAVMTVLSLVASRRLLGSGTLVGGALLPAPGSARDLWSTYLAGWHPIGLGSNLPAPPSLAVLAGLGTVLAGSAEGAVDLVLLAAVPLAALTAYLALPSTAGGVAVSAPLRLWGAVTYALLPPVLGAVAAGRIGTAALAVLLPVLAVCGRRALGLGPHHRADRRPSWRAVCAAGLVLSVISALVPHVWALAALVLLTLAAVTRRRGVLLRAGALVLLPLLVLAPWLPAVVSRSGLLLGEPGLGGPALASRRLDGLDLLLLNPGGPGLPPAVLTVGLLLAAASALLRPHGRRHVLLAWLVALLALAGALLVARTTLEEPTLHTRVPAWPGPLMLVAGGALVLAAVQGAAGARERVTTSAFGWRQPGAVLVLAAAVVAPLVVSGWWAVVGADGPLTRRDPAVLPAFVAANATQPSRPRTLVLRARSGGGLSYTLLRGTGPLLGDDELTAPSASVGSAGPIATSTGSVGPGDATGASAASTAAGGLDAVVADLASGRGGDAAAGLVPYGVRFVLLTRPVDRGVRRAVDGLPGVTRVASRGGTVLWEVDHPTGRVRLLPAAAADAAVVGPDGAAPDARVVRSGAVGAGARIPVGDPGRLVVLAEVAESGWRASLDGKSLPARTYAGWAQAFTLPVGGGRLVVTHDDGVRHLLVWGQLAVIVLLVFLAFPQLRAEDDDGDDVADQPTVGADPPVVASGVEP